MGPFQAQRFLSAIVASFVLSGCSGGGTAEQGRDDAAPTTNDLVSNGTKIFVTREGVGLPSECQPGRIAGFAVDFLATFTAGSRKAAARLFSDTGFVYSVVGPRGIFLESSRGELRTAVADYVGERHERGERLRLIELAVANTERRTYSGIGATQVAGVTFLLLRYAEDFGKSPVRYDGKANIICRDGTIVNWQMVPEDRQFAHRCPAPRPKPHGSFVVACADV